MICRYVHSLPEKFYCGGREPPQVLILQVLFAVFLIAQLPVPVYPIPPAAAVMGCEIMALPVCEKLF